MYQHIVGYIMKDGWVCDAYAYHVQDEQKHAENYPMTRVYERVVMLLRRFADSVDTGEQQ